MTSASLRFYFGRLIFTSSQPRTLPNLGPKMHHYPSLRSLAGAHSYCYRHAHAASATEGTCFSRRVLTNLAKIGKKTSFLVPHRASRRPVVWVAQVGPRAGNARGASRDHNVEAFIS